MSESAPPAAGSEIPRALQHGVPMLKVTKKKVKEIVFWLSEDQAIRWQSKKEGRVPIDQIREVRYGAGARPAVSQLPSSLAHSNRWISVIYIEWPSTWKSLHMVAPNDDVFEAWINTIASLLESIKAINHADGCIGILGALERLPMSKPASWNLDSAVDPHQAVTYNEVASMCAKIGIAAVPEGQIWKAFERSDIGSKGHLTFQEFKSFVDLVRRREELEGLFGSLTSTDRLGREEFVRFCTSCQKIAPVVADSLFVAVAVAMDGERFLDRKAFSNFLASTKNSVLSLEHSKIHQDMTRPLPEYFISSSHNTYLVGHQWKGDSTIEGYIRALLAGCRSVELDCWNGELEPVVYHGKTLTSKVSVRDICVAIKRYGFMASPYPIIISAEIHCTVSQQIALVGIMKDVFGPALVTTPLQAASEDAPLPSPEALRYRILLKAKRPLDVAAASQSDRSPTDAAFQQSSATESTESDFDRDVRREGSSRSFFGKVSAKVSSIVDPNALSPPSSLPRTGSYRAPRRSSSVDSIGSNISTASQKSTGPVIAPELADILVYTAGVKYQGFTKLVLYKTSDVFSVSEKTATKILRTAPADFIKHNRSHLSRVYPQGTRLTSTNYDPQRFWAMGSQLVAINWQTCDTGFMVNSAMFARNGRCGYVLKPDILLPRGKDLLWATSDHKLDIDVISGQHLPLVPDIAIQEMRLFVEVKLHLPPHMDIRGKDASHGTQSSPAAAITKSFKTKLLLGNTFNPIWNERHTLGFSCHAALLDLAFLEVELRHEPVIGDDVCIAQWCGSLSAMQQGYRYIPLSDAQMSQYLFSTLFLRLDMTTRPLTT